MSFGFLGSAIGGPDAKAKSSGLPALRRARGRGPTRSGSRSTLARGQEGRWTLKRFVCAPGAYVAALARFGSARPDRRPVCRCRPRGSRRSLHSSRTGRGVGARDEPIARTRGRRPSVVDRLPIPLGLARMGRRTDRRIGVGGRALGALRTVRDGGEEGRRLVEGVRRLGPVTASRPLARVRSEPRPERFDAVAARERARAVLAAGRRMRGGGVAERADHDGMSNDPRSSNQ